MITVHGVLWESTVLFFKNAPSILGAMLLWALTCWVPYIDVGTTIALTDIPIFLSKGEKFSPTFIFNRKYRQRISDYYIFKGVKARTLGLALVPFVVPTAVIYFGWSLATYLWFDKGMAHGEAFNRSMELTYGYKKKIMLIRLAVPALYFLLFFAVAAIISDFWAPFLLDKDHAVKVIADEVLSVEEAEGVYNFILKCVIAIFFIILPYILYYITRLSHDAVIYRKLVLERNNAEQ